MSYGFSKTLNLSYEKAIKKVTEELKKEGFGILTSIDVKETLKKKIDVDFKKYAILGACNPVLAHKALLDRRRARITYYRVMLLYMKKKIKRQFPCLTR